MIYIHQGRLAQMVLWMLQHHLLMQLHTYVQFMPTNDEFDLQLGSAEHERNHNHKMNGVEDGMAVTTNGYGVSSPKHSDIFTMEYYTSASHR